MRYFKSTFFIFLGVYLVIVVYYFVFQKNIIFYPTNDYAPPPIGFDIEEVFIKTQDGEILHGWWMKREGASKTVLFFHGNAGNLTDRNFRLDIFKRLELNALMIDYRGYGKSSGKIRREKDFPFLPIKQLLKFKFESGEKIQNVKRPILFTHSKKDDIIPFSESEMLYKKAQEPKEFLKLEKGDHNTDLILSYDEYFEGVRDFLSSIEN